MLASYCTFTCRHLLNLTMLTADFTSSLSKLLLILFNLTNSLRILCNWYECIIKFEAAHGNIMIHRSPRSKGPFKGEYIMTCAAGSVVRSLRFSSQDHVCWWQSGHWDFYLYHTRSYWKLEAKDWIHPIGDEGAKCNRLWNALSYGTH